MPSVLVDAGPLIALADASLIWVAQHAGVVDILTIDLKDFSVYRLPNGKALHPVL